MTQHVHDMDTGSAVRWTSPERGEWTADRNGTVVGGIHRDEGRYVATRGRRTVGRYRSLDAALAAVDHRGLTTLAPNRTWAVMLAGINIGIVAAISLVATAILR